MNTLEQLEPYYMAARLEAGAYEQDTPLQDLEWMIAELPDGRSGFADALTAEDGVAVIAEHKRKSPSEGQIGPGLGVTWTVEQYQKGGAAAVSILTQRIHFGGSIEDLVEARQAVDLPILRKDFIDREYQLYQAKAFGADAALLIAGGLSDDKLKDLHEEAEAIGLDCLVEVHNEAELCRALEIGTRLLGINNRDLSTMRVDTDTARGLIGMVPKDVTVVAESGYSVREPRHMGMLRELAVDAVLIGTSLVREENPAQALSAWQSAVILE